MRTFVLAATLMASLVMATPAFSAENDAAPAVKIGVFDMQTVATQSEPAKAMKKMMDDKYGDEKKKLEKQGEALKKKAEGLKNPKVGEDKRVAFIRAKQDLDQKTREFMRRVEQDEVKMRQQMVTLIFEATKNVAEEKKFTYVVDLTAGGVVYADVSMDLTDAVQKEVDKLYKAKKSEKKEEKK